MFGLLAGLGGGGLGQGKGQRGANGFALACALQRTGFRVGMQALHHLQRKGALHAALLQVGKEGLRAVVGAGRIVVPAGQGIAQAVGRLACRFFSGHALGQAAQVFHQHHAQCGGQGPQLALGEGLVLLVGLQQLDHQARFEGAVGVGHIGPGDGVDAWQSGQRADCQNGQAAEVAARQAVVHLMRLRHHKVDVVQQPGACGADVAAVALLLRNGRMGLVQHGDVLAQTRKERCGVAGPRGFAMRQRQIEPQLVKAGCAQQFGADGWLLLARHVRPQGL